jgi:hypothetical protein
VDVGKLTLGVIWNGHSVSATDIRSTRPMAAQILRGKTPAQVLQIVPLLFSVCGRAQGAAASAAMRAAQQGDEPVAAAVERQIVCEALQEHLWRLMLDWPKLMSLERQEQRFTVWYAMLRKIAVGEIGMQVFLQEFERDYLGMTVAEWNALGSYHELQVWISKAHSPLAQLLTRLIESARGFPATADARLLPAWTAAQANQACAMRWATEFAARPDWLGDAAETGAWSYYAESKLLRDVGQQSGSIVLTRVLARIMDVVAMAMAMASASAALRLDVCSAEAGVGVAVVRTARGLLMHRVLLESGLVQDYVIVAPTEWNFHQQGAFAQGMHGLVGTDEESLKQLAHIAALSLDPCVAYEVEIRNA